MKVHGSIPVILSIIIIAFTAYIHGYSNSPLLGQPGYRLNRGGNT